jgi:hypothetical protein
MTAGDPERVPAEVWPQPGQLRNAAAALQQLGFRVLHLGATISVDAPATVWRQVFGDSLRTGQVSIPATLHGLVDDVSFVEPPDLHR